MIKHLFALVFTALSVSSYAEEILDHSTSTIQTPLLPWTTDFNQALNMAKAESLPIYLYFTGSTWCIWCKKLEKEIHEQDNFRQKVVGKFIFVKIDLPAGMQADEKTKELMQKYAVLGVPTIIIVSPEGQEIARFRYQKIAPEAFADQVLAPVMKK